MHSIGQNIKSPAYVCPSVRL